MSTLRYKGRFDILLGLNITGTQIVESLIAIPAFIPVTVCPGYLFAWFTNLYDFRRRSLVERIFWTLPLSLVVSTISAVLIGKFFSLFATVVLFVANAALWLFVLAGEWLQLRRNDKRWSIGFRPLGGKAVALVILWVAGAVVSLVDIEVDHRLFLNVSLLDESYRVNWTESVLRTGVPPVNSLYLYKYPAPMRNYYFWYVLCATVSKMTHLSVRPVFTASCIWAGFVLAAIIGLFLKHFLAVGARLRRQFLLAIMMLAITGLDLCVVLWNLFLFHIPPPADLEAWSRDGIVSWLHTLFWAPHHLVSMCCCMFAFLLAWIAPNGSKRDQLTTAVLIAFALSSAFGLSIFVTFAFFLVATAWAVWQVVFERNLKAPLCLASGGAGALILLIPYLRELMQPVSSTNRGPATGTTHLFSLAVRQMIPPDGLLATHFFRDLFTTHPLAATSLANLLLLVPGYALELGFYFAVFLLFVAPGWRGRESLTAPQRTLIFIALAILPFMSFIRSGVLQTNDFAWRAAMFVQFPLLLLGSELVAAWNVADRKWDAPADRFGLPSAAPRWMRAVASLALVIGVFSTISQALILRFLIPLGDLTAHVGEDQNARNLSQKAYISAMGFAALNKVIPQDATVQADPENLDKDRMAEIVDLLWNNHQTIIAVDKGECGAELGGDASGCPILAQAIDQLYKGGSASQAQAACREYGIQYLVARVYEPIWKERNAWVWKLEPVFANDDFRTVKCGH